MNTEERINNFLLEMIESFCQEKYNRGFIRSLFYGLLVYVAPKSKTYKAVEKLLNLKDKNKPFDKLLKLY